MKEDLMRRDEARFLLRRKQHELNQLKHLLNHHWGAPDSFYYKNEVNRVSEFFVGLEAGKLLNSKDECKMTIDQLVDVLVNLRHLHKQDLEVCIFDNNRLCTSRYIFIHSQHKGNDVKIVLGPLNTND